MGQVSPTALAELTPTPRVGEFATTRPTPSQAESDALAGSNTALVMRKQWDLSPVDPNSHDPTEPPGRPTGSVRSSPEVAPRIGEFATTLPTPMQAESDSLSGQGVLVMRKHWDLSPVDPNAFDPTEPPGRPEGPPVNTVLPVVSGTPSQGSVLTTSNGTWSGSPTFTYQWLRNGTARPASTASSIILNAQDAGAMISCGVVATNAAGTVGAESAAVGPITAPPANTAAPAVTGTTVTGSTLTTTNGTWTGSPTPTYTRQWLRDGNNIGAATGLTYVLVALDEGTMISCRVTGTNSAGSVPATSTAVGPITPTAADPGGDESALPHRRRNGKPS
jgi:hypothetical protein